jgi:Pyruvate/2-oxoacid:ferredoxin oxidoreductase delta subunit/DNA-binding Lrp family transcriptional regulator
MAKDLYEKLLNNYELLLGRMPNHDQFKAALKDTLTEEDIRVIFLLPFDGEVPIAKFEQKAAKIGIDREKLHAILKRLIPEGFIASFIRGADVEPLDMEHPGRVVMRGDIISMTELQVRKHEDDPMRQVSAVYFNAMSEDAGRSIPSKTPYLRVIPVEATLTPKPERQRIEVNVPIPDPSAVLPLDVVSQMVRGDSEYIAVAECYCRRTKVIMGEPCNHPLETCLYFNELARLQVEAGRARRIEADEAIDILRMAEEAGLVHNVSNSMGHISTICACCLDACGAMKSLKMRGRNATAVSRFIVQLDETKCTLCGACVEKCPIQLIKVNGRLTIEVESCFGCGLCAYKCPEGALAMVSRENPPKIYKSKPAMMRQITIEALAGMAKKAITGHY